MFLFGTGLDLGAAESGCPELFLSTGWPRPGRSLGDDRATALEKKDKT